MGGKYLIEIAYANGKERKAHLDKEELLAGVHIALRKILEGEGSIKYFSVSVEKSERIRKLETRDE